MIQSVNLSFLNFHYFGVFMSYKVYQEGRNTVIIGNVLGAIRFVPKEYCHMAFFSPPYYRRRIYGVVEKWPDGWVGELGWEPTVEQYAEHVAEVVKLLSRVLTKDASIFINIDDSKIHNNVHKPFRSTTGHIVNVPDKITDAIERVGWRLIRKYIVVKGYVDVATNSFISRIYRRNTPSYHHYEYVLHFVRSNELRGRGELMSDVIYLKKDYVTSSSHHSSSYPMSLVEPFIENFTFKGDVVIDPFSGTGTTGVVARRKKRKFVLIEANEEAIAFNKLGFRL